MDISVFTIRLSFLLIPGAISCLIIEAIARHKKWELFRFIIFSIILSVVTMSILQILFDIYQSFFNFTSIFTKEYTFNSLKVWDCIFNNGPVNQVEIIFSIVIAILLGYFVGWIVEKKIVNRIANKLKLSYRFGDDSLFMGFLGSTDVEWVYIRDRINGLTYSGYVDSYSEDGNDKEILLINVTVYDYVTSRECYTVNKMYLKFHERDIIIEVPKIEI